jgi:CheY-like chemotaxis protein
MQSSLATRPKEILLVEDSPTDIKMVLMALKKSGRPKQVTTSTDGEQAMARLNAPPAGLPDLVILDLNLPKMDGWQVLARCKGDAALKCIPIVVFTTSERQADVDRCYALGANSFVTKPFDLAAFQDAVAMIEEFWLGLAAPWEQG